MDDHFVLYTSSGMKGRIFCMHTNKLATFCNNNLIDS